MLAHGANSDLGETEVTDILSFPPTLWIQSFQDGRDRCCPGSKESCCIPTLVDICITAVTRQHGRYLGVPYPLLQVSGPCVQRSDGVSHLNPVQGTTVSVGEYHS